MMILIAAAGLAAQPSATPTADPMVQHAQHQPADHKGMDCCKDCCTDMAAKHEGHASDEHPDHNSH